MTLAISSVILSDSAKAKTLDILVWYEQCKSTQQSQTNHHDHQAHQTIWPNSRLVPTMQLVVQGNNWLDRTCSMIQMSILVIHLHRDLDEPYDEDRYPKQGSFQTVDSVLGCCVWWVACFVLGGCGIGWRWFELQHLFCLFLVDRQSMRHSRYNCLHYVWILFPWVLIQKYWQVVLTFSRCKSDFVGIEGRLEEWTHIFDLVVAHSDCLCWFIHIHLIWFGLFLDWLVGG